MLTLGWTDGYSFIPVDFAMLSSAKKQNRYRETDEKIDKRTNGYKRRKEAVMKKTDTAVQLIRNALNAGVRADYVLMDSWFTNGHMIQAVLNEGLDVIGMLKKRNHYMYKGKACSMEKRCSSLRKNKSGDILGAVIAETKTGIGVKLVFVRNRNVKNQWLVILSTDLSLSDSEVVRIYGNRWSIEVFFKASKSCLKLGSEFQGHSYDMTVSHTTLVYSRYIILEWLRRQKNDEKTFGELFFVLCDDIKYMDLSTALMSLMGLFVEQLQLAANKATKSMKSQLQQWISSQALYIQVLFEHLSWES